MTAAPLGYLTASGARAAEILPLTWFVSGTAVLVCLAIAGVLWLGIRTRRARGVREPRLLPIRRDGDGVSWIWLGVGISLLPLLAILVWTLVVLARIGPAPARPALTIDVNGHQWWWEITYRGDRPDLEFRTANELHLPVGVPVLVRLHSSDVIHSFWVPQLAGKTDAIPGQVNVTWLEADEPGRYRGQCSEFCGMQHAHMAMEVVAETPDQFADWWQRQLQPAPEPHGIPASRGRVFFESRCALCHAIRGTPAASHVGPDLTHLRSRRLLAAGARLNNPGTLAGWIENPQSLKPGVHMPDQLLPAGDLQDVTAYLETLR